MTHFLYGNPVPPERFIGRARELRDVVNRLSPEGQSAALIGEPRSGKTSLLEYLQSPAVLARVQTLSPRRLAFASVDAHNLVAGFSQAGFWSDVLEQVNASGAFKAAGPEIKEALRACTKSSFQTRSVGGLLKRLCEDDRRLVVLVDEFDYLVHQCIASHSEFFASLRGLASGSHRSLALVVASREPIGQLNDLAATHASAGSPYFNIYHEIHLGPFSDADVDELLSKVPNQFSPGDRRFVHDASGGFPYLVQVAASAVWKAYEDGIPDPDVRRREAACALLRTTTPMLNDIWRHWSPRVRYVFAAVAAEHLESAGDEAGWGAPGPLGGPAHVADAETFRDELYILKEYGFITERRGTPSGLGVRPMILLAWCAAKLRSYSQSMQLWTGWCHSEGWDGILSPRRKKTWDEIVRERAKSVRTDVDALIRADNPETGAVAAPRRSLSPSSAPSSTTPAAARQLRLCYMYTEADEPFRERLDKHLSALRYEGLLETWWHHKVLPGDDCTDEIDKHLEQADIFVLLVSADFLASDDLFGPPLRRAMDRRARRRARVIPIRTRPADWGNLPFASLEALPRGIRAVSQWTDSEEAWAQISQEIRRIIAELSELGVE